MRARFLIRAHTSARAVVWRSYLTSLMPLELPSVRRGDGETPRRIETRGLRPPRCPSASPLRFVQLPLPLLELLKIARGFSLCWQTNFLHFRVCTPLLPSTVRFKLQSTPSRIEIIPKVGGRRGSSAEMSSFFNRALHELKKKSTFFSGERQ